MPKNSIEVEGPIVFSCDRGTLRFEKRAFNVEIQRSEGELGKSTTRKSLVNEEQTEVYLFNRIQQSASERESNIFGLLRQPKVAQKNTILTST